MQKFILTLWQAGWGLSCLSGFKVVGGLGIAGMAGAILYNVLIGSRAFFPVGVCCLILAWCLADPGVTFPGRL